MRPGSAQARRTRDGLDDLLWGLSGESLRVRAGLKCADTRDATTRRPCATRPTCRRWRAPSSTALSVTFTSTTPARKRRPNSPSSSEATTNRQGTCGSGESLDGSHDSARADPRPDFLRKKTDSYHGGWLAPDIYFLGFAGSVLVDGWLRIAGASGIWKSGDWKKGESVGSGLAGELRGLKLKSSHCCRPTGHFENIPFDDRTIRSVYHIREYDVARLLQVRPSSQPLVLSLVGRLRAGPDHASLMRWRTAQEPRRAD